MGNHVTLTFYDTMIVNKKVFSKNMDIFLCAAFTKPLNMIKILVYRSCTLQYTPPDVTSIDKGYQSKAGEPAHPTYYILPCFQKLRRKSCISVSQVLRPIKWVPFSTPKLLQLLLMIIAFLFQFMPLRKALVITDTSFSRLLRRPLQPLTLVAVVPLSVRSSKESVVGRRSMQPDINNYCIDLL